MPQPTSSFYADLPPIRAFDALADAASYTPLPDDWVICCSDIVDSTGLSARGEYKTVNTVGAAVISAMTNALSSVQFPYVFGGDGASFAVPPDQADLAHETLAKLRAWVDREFAITLRAAMLPVKWIRDEGQDVQVARYAVTPHVEYAMFRGGGLAWAEHQMKQGAYEIRPSGDAEAPDLSGLSCRWKRIKSHNGVILSLLVLPAEDVHPDRFGAVASELLELARGLEREGHPLPSRGPEIAFSLKGLSVEARISRMTVPLLWAKLRLLLVSIFTWIVLRFKLPVKGFDPAHYLRTLSLNADFRKFDDGLKMTLDCDLETRNRLQALLNQARDAGVVRFGWHEQDEAQVTCIVPSAFRDDHIHFVDGAAGGYAEAARALRRL
ncbi:DUF3095 family protein [Epibacterium sp. SM1969]|uniref:DUF3095 family protein n=1 Tax=Tritonibacter aquimaris TaxID=2663379 RepID=A0A844AY54_9RHOB|nr:DUF3095 domain-containing protein [Tritonibacter aquimaris]MQY42106.1 DUF3095 family protein [Tritonibacter aquimaris]